MIKWLNNLMLSASQWIIIMLSGAVAFLYFMFRSKERALHKAGLELLRAQVARRTEEDEARIKAATEAYKKALKEYEDSRD